MFQLRRSLRPCQRAAQLLSVAHVWAAKRQTNRRVPLSLSTTRCSPPSRALLSLRTASCSLLENTTGEASQWGLCDRPLKKYPPSADLRMSMKPSSPLRLVISVGILESGLLHKG